MPEISVVIPVYNAEKVLRRCVESIIFGEERDLEVILLEDCSADGSWALCQTLAAEYPQVVCLQNDRNRGVSYTRNRGLDTATGRYLLFVDSDDWVSGSYVKTLITAARENPGALVVCGYTLVDLARSTQRYHGISDAKVLPRREFHRLNAHVMIQQLWNKVFYLPDIRKAGIRFDETISVGEDYCFVMDVLERLDYQQCVVIPEPLYYYIRYGSGSLMDQWFKHETYEEALSRTLRLENLCGLEPARVAAFQKGFAYRIMWETPYSNREKLRTVQKILGPKEGRSFYCRQWLIHLRSQVQGVFKIRGRRISRMTGKLEEQTGKIRARSAVRQFRKRELTVISQNDIGEVLTRDLGLPACAPAAKLYFPAGDYIRFVKNLEHYLNAPLKLVWGERYPIGRLDDVQIHFIHYDNCRQALDAWEHRNKQIDPSQVLVLCTDGDGFEEALFEQWKTIPYPKLLFTACKQYADHEDSLYFPRYQSLGSVPDLIPKREFYRKRKLIRKINTMV